MPEKESSNNLKQRARDLSANLDPIQHLKNLDYPRRAGTEGNRDGAAYIAQTLKQNGIEPATQEFHFAKPRTLPRLMMPLVIVVWILLSLANIRFWNSNLIVSLLVLAVPLALILLILNMDWMMRRSFRRQRKKLAETRAKIDDGALRPDEVVTGQNIIAEIGSADAEKHILFTAHHDSISSVVPMRLTTVCMIAGLIGLLLHSLAYLAHVIIGPQSFVAQHFTIFAIIAAIVLILVEIALISRIFRSNASHGIIDDGTGVAILLELAKFVRAQEIPNAKFTFGFFDAEEAGLIGSAHYYMNGAFDKKKLHVISVDMIGEKPPLAYVKGIYPVRRRRMEATFNAQIEEIAQGLGIEIEGKHFPYPGSDFGHFLLDGGYTTNWFISQSRLIHSKRDNLGNVNEKLVKDALTLLVAYLSQ